MSFDYDILLSQLEMLSSDDSLLQNVPAHLRQRFIKASRTTSIRLQTPSEAMARVMLCQPVEEMVIRIATDAKLLSALAASSAPRSASALASATKIDQKLLTNDIVREREDGYILDSSFSLLADPNMSAAYGGCEDYLRRQYSSLPKLLEQLNYAEPCDPNSAAIQHGYGQVGTPVMDILRSDTHSLQSLSVLMSIWQDGFTQLQTLYPVPSSIISSFDPSISDVIFVDVGGNFGQKAIALKSAFPSMPGRVVVQDLPEVIDLAKAAPGRSAELGVEMMPHDFTTKQPIHGAKVYYIRQCLHNWIDETCIVILKQLREAMRPGYSKVIIHEIIMPQKGAGLWPVTQDFEMMCACATRERTESEWRKICQASGLRVTKVYPADDPSCEGLIEAEVL